MAVRSGDDRQVCLRLLQRLASARRAIIGIYFPPIPWPMTSLHCRRCSSQHGRSELCSRWRGLLHPPHSLGQPLASQTMTILRMLEKKRAGGGGGISSTTQDNQKYASWAHHLFCLISVWQKSPGWQMRWPSGPDANKTRPHWGIFLHIKP